MTEGEISPEIREALRFMARLDAQIRTVIPVFAELGRQFNDNLTAAARSFAAAYEEALRREQERRSRADGGA